MPHRTPPMTGLLLFTGLNAILVSTMTPVYDFVCFLPYWEQRLPDFHQREHQHEERKAELAEGSGSA